jgi:hypothetical protein
MLAIDGPPFRGRERRRLGVVIEAEGRGEDRVRGASAVDPSLDIPGGVRWFPEEGRELGVELITAVPLPPADPQSNPPPSSRIPIGQVTVASLVWPGATATPSPSTAVASPRLARKDRGGRDVRAADRSGREVLVED